MIGSAQRASSTRFRYLQVPARDAEWGIYVTTLGWGKIPRGAVYPPAEHPGAYTLGWERGRVLKEYQLISVTQGGGVLDTEAARHRIYKGDVLVLTPGMWHRYRPDEETGWYESWIGFNGAMVEQLFKAQHFQERAVVHLRPDLSLKAEYREAARLVREAQAGMQQRLAAVVMGMLAKVYTATIPATRRSDRADNLIDLAVERLRTGPEVSLEGLAAELEVSYSWFRRKFCEHVGMSPHQYRLHLQATRAQTLLRTTELSVREIAGQTGFQTEQYFCRLFKRHTGRTPLEFRKISKG
jgi:AraC-like DNA-binding protein